MSRNSICQYSCKGDTLKNFLETVAGLSDLSKAFESSCYRCNNSRYTKFPPTDVTMRKIQEFAHKKGPDGMAKGLTKKALRSIYSFLDISTKVKFNILVFKYGNNEQQKFTYSQMSVKERTQIIDTSSNEIRQEYLIIECGLRGQNIVEHILNYKVTPPDNVWYCTNMKSATLNVLLNYGFLPEVDHITAAQKILYNCLTKKADIKNFLSRLPSVTGGMFPSDHPLYSRNKLVDIFLECGWKPTYNDILFLIQKGCCVPDVEQYNFKFDDTFERTCNANSYFPYPSIFQSNVKHLNKLIENSAGLADIKRVLKTTSPDQLTFEMACIKLRIPVIKLLLNKKYNFKLDIELINKIVPNVTNKSNNNAFQLIWNAYYEANK